MTQADMDEVTSQLSLEQVTAELVRPGSPAVSAVPDRWRLIAESDDPQERVRAALALWNPDFLGILPRFATMFQERLTDVRVFLLRQGGEEHVVLVYVAGRDYEDEPVLWLGWDSAAFGQEPLLFETLPEPARRFLRETHAGFTAQDWESFGLMRPEFFELLKDRAGFPGVEAEVEGGTTLRRESTAWLTKDFGALFFCVSPDLPVGEAVLFYEGNFDPPGDFGERLDHLMAGRWDPWAALE